MTSKRGIRRRNERMARLKQEELESKMTEKHQLMGGVGRTSVADIILARTRFLHPDKQDKPAIQLVQPNQVATNKLPANQPVITQPSANPIIATKLGNRTTGFCKAIMKGLQSKLRYTETEIAEFAYKWQDLVTWVSDHLPAARAEVQAALGKAYLWYGPEKIEPFCERFIEVKFVEDGDPARALYLALQKAKINRINAALVAYKKTLACVEATMNDKPMQRLYERDEDLFQWQEGWELPQGSWWANHK